MRKIALVEQARAVMTEGTEWSSWKWMLEKRRVREIADRATVALSRANQRAKSGWPEGLRAAYEAVANGSKSKNSLSPKGRSVVPELLAAAKRIKKADERAAHATREAEQMFDEAERTFSAEMARDAARKALESYDLREAAIGEAEAVTEGKNYAGS